MSKALTITGNNLELAERANKKAQDFVFSEYQLGKAENTLKNQRNSLDKFSDFLKTQGLNIPAESLYRNPNAWASISWGLVKGFVLDLLQQGFAVSTVNIRLGHIKKYAKLAFQAGIVSQEENLKIQAVKSYNDRQASRIDEKREEAGIETRIGNKKEEPTLLNEEQIDALMRFPYRSTGQGLRDLVILGLGLYHGLRASEMSALKVADIEISYDDNGKPASGIMTFQRPKLKGLKNEIGKHTIKKEFLPILSDYLKDYASKEPDDKLLKPSRKGGKLLNRNGFSEIAITTRIAYLGERVSAINKPLSTHDLRHTSATMDAKQGKDPLYLLSKFGWTNFQTAMNYIHLDDVVKIE